MHELVPGARVTGNIYLDGDPIYGNGIDAVDIRRKVGMVFQKPNPFPHPVYTRQCNSRPEAERRARQDNAR